MTSLPRHRQLGEPAGWGQGRATPPPSLAQGSRIFKEGQDTEVLSVKGGTREGWNSLEL